MFEFDDSYASTRSALVVLSFDAVLTYRYFGGGRDQVMTAVSMRPASMQQTSENQQPDSRPPHLAAVSMAMLVPGPALSQVCIQAALLWPTHGWRPCRAVLPRDKVLCSP